MKKIICLLILAATQTVYSQDTTTILSNAAKESVVSSICKCIDSISVSNKPKQVVGEEAHDCISRQVLIYQIMASISISTKGDTSKKREIVVNANPESSTYKTAYFELERMVMEKCPSLKSKLSSNDVVSEKSFSNQKRARELYDKGLEASKEGDFKKAVNYYKKAVESDPEFAFAWDNLGLCYRKLGEYEKALEAYQRSLEIDSLGQMPMQNIAIVYTYMKDYPKAIEAYQRLAVHNENNPEIYYGIGTIYLRYLNEPEKALDNLCKAYNIYIEQKSPYRTDAETLINEVFAIMKKDGKTDRFYEILKSHNINAQ